MVRCVDLSGSRAGFLFRFWKKEISKHPILDVLRTRVSWRQHFTRNAARNRKRFLGHYYDFDQYFYVTPGDASPGVGYSVGSGISDGKANPSHQFYSFGIVSGVLSRLSKRCTSANVSSLGRESSIPVSSEFDLLRFVDAAHASYIPLRGSGFGFLLKS